MTVSVLLASTSSIASIASLVLSLLLLVYVVLQTIFAYKRGFLHSLLRLGTVIVTAVLSLVGALLMRDVVGDQFEHFIHDMFDSEGFSAITDASPTVAALLHNLPGALAGPLLFFALFLLLNIIFLIVYKFLKRITFFSKLLMPKTVDKILGAVVGLVCSLLLVSCFLVPFSGYVSMADDVLTEIQKVELDEKIANEIEPIDKDYVSPLANNPAFVVSNAILGVPVFETLTSCDIGDDSISLVDEMSYLAKTYVTLFPLVDIDFDFTRFEKEQGDALRKFAADFDDSVLVPHIMGELLPAAATKWNAGDTFGGISSPAKNAPENLQSLMNNTITIMETTTHKTLKGDLVTLAELVATLAESGTLSTMSNATSRDIIQTLSAPGVVSGLVDILYANERTQILVVDLSNIGFDAIGDSLEIPKTDEEVRAHLTADLNEAIKKAEKLEGYDTQINDLTNSITNIFAEYGVDTKGDEAKLYAEAIIGYGPITSEGEPEAAVTEYFKMIATALAQVEGSETASGVTLLFSSMEQDERMERVISIIRTYQERNGIESLKDSHALADQITGESELIHAVITLDEILVNQDEIFVGTADDFHTQAVALEEILAVLSDAMTEESETIPIDYKALDSQKLSSALQKLSTTRTDSEGQELHNLAGAVTNVVKSAIQKTGIDAVAANDLVDHIAESQPDENGNQKDTLGVALTMVTIIKKDSASQDDMKENINLLVKDLDKDSAKVLSDCVSPNLIGKYTTGTFTPERTDAIVVVTKDLLDNFGSHSDDLSEEQLDAEATYMQTIFDLATTANNGQSAPLFSSEENTESKLGKTADEFVASVKHSVVITETVLEETDALQLAIGNKMRATDKEALQKAVDADTELSDDLRSALQVAFSLNTQAE